MDIERDVPETDLADLPFERRGFWASTKDGHPVHINGDPDMSDETVAALLALMEAVAASYCFHEGVKDLPDNLIHRNRFGVYFFEVWRCEKCQTAFVEVTAEKHVGVLATLPTKIMPYYVSRPNGGYAYSWRFQDLNHTTAVVKGLKPKEEAHAISE